MDVPKICELKNEDKKENLLKNEEEEKKKIETVNNVTSSANILQKQDSNVCHEDGKEISKCEVPEEGLLSEGEISYTLENISSDRYSLDEFSDFDKILLKNDSRDVLLKSDLRIRITNNEYYEQQYRRSKERERKRRSRSRRRRYRRSSSSERSHTNDRYDKWSRDLDYTDYRKHRYSERSEYSYSRKQKLPRRSRSRSPYHKEYRKSQNYDKRDRRKSEKKGSSPTENSYHRSEKRFKREPSKTKITSTGASIKNKTQGSPIDKWKTKTSFHSNIESGFEKIEANKTKKNRVDDKSGVTTLKNKESDDLKPADDLDMKNEAVIDITSISNINSVLPSVTSEAAVNIPLPPPPPNSHEQFNPNSSNVSSNVPAFGQGSVPAFGVPNGLPVQFTPTGYQILYDVDGRRIPIGPNGHYLPLDPFGRVFAHVISPDNFAIPIFLTEDGVLRLPNYEPVPFGPPHQLPINIDGHIILIGPDSRPLYPCSGVPKWPSSCVVPKLSSLIQNNISPSSNCNTSTPISKGQNVLSSQKSKPSMFDISSLDAIVDSFPVIQKNELLKQYQAEVEQKKNTFPRYHDEEKNLAVKALKSISPIKVSPAKKSEDSNCGYSSDMVLDSSDSCSSNIIDFASKSSIVEKYGDVLSSENEGNLEILCDVSMTNMVAFLNDTVVKRIQVVLKSLEENHFQPPPRGRFILSELNREFLPDPDSNASPLLRNRVQLPFISLCRANCEGKLEKSTSENEKGFRFCSREKLRNVDKVAREKEEGGRKKIFRLDFTVQCDFTTEEISSLNCKIAELTSEIARVKKSNANMKDLHRRQQRAIEEKTQLLNKVLNEVKEKTVEIESLKRALGKNRR